MKNSAKSLKPAAPLRASGQRAKKVAAPATGKAVPRLCVFKVALCHNRRTWRRIAIREDQTLETLHGAIYSAFKHDDDHLYAFYVLPPDGQKHRHGHVKRPSRGAVEYQHPHCVEGDPDARNAATTPLADLRLQPGRRLEYLFDFGDNLWHELTVEVVGVPAEKDARYPLVLDQRDFTPLRFARPEDESEDE